MTTGSPRPKVAYQILMPLTGAKPKCAAWGNIGVGGSVSHCGAACAAAPAANRMAAAKRLRTVDIPFSRLKMSFHTTTTPPRGGAGSERRSFEVDDCACARARLAGNLNRIERNDPAQPPRERSNGHETYRSRIGGFVRFCRCARLGAGWRP